MSDIVYWQDRCGRLVRERDALEARLAEAEQQWDDWSARAEMAETAQVRAERERNDALARLADAHAAKTKAEESELACAAELDEVRTRLAECERDAARYRWLRLRLQVTAVHCRDEAVQAMPLDIAEPTGESYAEDVDRAIDAAMGDGT